MPYVEIESGVRLFYQDLGRGRPVVLVHGFGMSHEVWDHQITALLDHYRVVALDLRGHGDSDKPAHGYSYADGARDVQTLLEALDLRDVALVGWSRGGGIVAQTAASYPDRLAQMVLVAAATPRVVPAPDFLDLPPVEMRLKRLEEERTRRPEYRQWVVEQSTYRRLSEPTMRWLWQVTMKTPSWVGAACLTASLREDLRADVPHIKTPTLVLHGRYDVLVPLALSRWMAEHLPDVRNGRARGLGAHAVSRGTGALQR